MLAFSAGSGDDVGDDVGDGVGDGGGDGGGDVEGTCGYAGWSTFSSCTWARYGASSFAGKMRS